MLCICGSTTRAVERVRRVHVFGSFIHKDVHTLGNGCYRLSLRRVHRYRRMRTMKISALFGYASLFCVVGRNRPTGVVGAAFITPAFKMNPPWAKRQRGVMNAAPT